MSSPSFRHYFLQMFNGSENLIHLCRSGMRRFPTLSSFLDSVSRKFNRHEDFFSLGEGIMQCSPLPYSFIPGPPALTPDLFRWSDAPLSLFRLHVSV